MIFQFILFYFIYFSEKIFNNLDLYNEDEEEQNNNDADGIGFSASSYAVLENENTSNIMIKRTGPTDREVTFRFAFFITTKDG